MGRLDEQTAIALGAAESVWTGLFARTDGRSMYIGPVDSPSKRAHPGDSDARDGLDLDRERLGSDSPDGISAEKIPMPFQNFVQVDSSRVGLGDFAAAG